MQFLNKKKVKEIFSILDNQWDLKKGFEKKLDFVFLLNSKNKIYVINNEIVNVDFDALRIDSMGMYFGELKEGDTKSKEPKSRGAKNKEIRLSIEGSQILGEFARKNVIEISDGLMKLWIRGYDVEVKTKNSSGEKETKDESSLSAYVIVKNNNDFFGCGRLKEGNILNHIPKSRRVRSVD